FTAKGDPRTYADLCTPAGLAAIAKYANGIGAEKNLLVTRDRAGNLGKPTDLVAHAHAAGLRVHAWTFRNEDTFLPKNLQGQPEAEYEPFLNLGIDGLFSDHPDTAVKVCRAFWAKKQYRER